MPKALMILGPRHGELFDVPDVVDRRDIDCLCEDPTLSGRYLPYAYVNPEDSGTFFLYVFSPNHQGRPEHWQKVHDLYAQLTRPLVDTDTNGKESANRLRAQLRTVWHALTTEPGPGPMEVSHWAWTREYAKALELREAVSKLTRSVADLSKADERPDQATVEEVIRQRNEAVAEVEAWKTAAANWVEDPTPDRLVAYLMLSDESEVEHQHTAENSVKLLETAKTELLSALKTAADWEGVGKKHGCIDPEGLLRFIRDLRLEVGNLSRVLKSTRKGHYIHTLRYMLQEQVAINREWKRSVFSGPRMYAIYNREGYYVATVESEDIAVRFTNENPGAYFLPGYLFVSGSNPLAKNCPHARVKMVFGQANGVCLDCHAPVFVGSDFASPAANAVSVQTLSLEKDRIRIQITGNVAEGVLSPVQVERFTWQKTNGFWLRDWQWSGTWNELRYERIPRRIVYTLSRALLSGVSAPVTSPKDRERLVTVKVNMKGTQTGRFTSQKPNVSFESPMAFGVWSTLEKVAETVRPFDVRTQAEKVFDALEPRDGRKAPPTSVKIPVPLTAEVAEKLQREFSGIVWVPEGSKDLDLIRKLYEDPRPIHLTPLNEADKGALKAFFSEGCSLVPARGSAEVNNEAVQIAAKTFEYMEREWLRNLYEQYKGSFTWGEAESNDDLKRMIRGAMWEHAMSGIESGKARMAKAGPDKPRPPKPPAPGPHDYLTGMSFEQLRELCDTYGLWEVEFDDNPNGRHTLAWIRKQIRRIVKERGGSVCAGSISGLKPIDPRNFEPVTASGTVTIDKEPPEGLPTMSTACVPSPENAAPDSVCEAAAGPKPTPVEHTWNDLLDRWDAKQLVRFAGEVGLDLDPDQPQMIDSYREDIRRELLALGAKIEPYRITLVDGSFVNGFGNWDVSGKIPVASAEPKDILNEGDAVPDLPAVVDPDAPGFMQS